MLSARSSPGGQVTPVLHSEDMKVKGPPRPPQAVAGFHITWIRESALYRVPTFKASSLYFLAFLGLTDELQQWFLTFTAC